MMAEAHLSDYERARLERIAENHKRMTELNLAFIAATMQQQGVQGERRASTRWRGG